MHALSLRGRRAPDRLAPSSNGGSAAAAGGLGGDPPVRFLLASEPASPATLHLGVIITARGALP
jgi:hypothetical protein